MYLPSRSSLVFRRARLTGEVFNFVAGALFYAPTARECGNVAAAHFGPDARVTFGAQEYGLSTVAYSYDEPVLVVLRDCYTGEAHTLCTDGAGWSRTTAKHIVAFRRQRHSPATLPLPLSALAADQVAALIEESAKSLARALRARTAHSWWWGQYTHTLQGAQRVATLAGLPNPLAEGAPHQRLEGAALAKYVALRLRGAFPANA